MSRSSASTTERTSGARAWPACALIFAVTLLAYFPALRSGLVWNDPDYVTQPELRSLAGLERIWFELGATEQYYPVLHSAFWIEHRLWGDAPFGYHLVNVLLHAANACLLGLILRRLLQIESAPGERRFAGVEWLAALLFALHPVCVESVAWISEQKNTLSTFFYLAAGLAYLGFAEKRRTTSYVLATGWFVLALLSKSVTASLPAALLVVLWWRRGRLTWRDDIRPLLPWFILSAGFGLFSAWVERTVIGAEGAAFALTLTQRVLVAGRAIWFYLGKLVWPAPLMFFYPRWTIDASAAWQYAFPLAALGALVGLWWMRPRSRGPLTAALLFVGGLFPVLGFFNVYAFIFSFTADHFQYLACLSVIAALAAGVTLALDRTPRWLRLGVIACLLGTLGARTWRQCGMYQDIVTFYRAILADNPASWLASYNLANLLRESGQTAEAIRNYEQALRIKADYPEAQNNLGLALVSAGEFKVAITHYEQALRLKPNYVAAHNNLGIALRADGDTGRAITEYQAALRLKPDYAEACYNLGLALAEVGRMDESTARFQQAVRLRPDFPDALNSLGSSLLAAGNPREAAVQYEHALKYKPDYVEALNNLGNVRHQLGQNQEAIALYRQALRVRADLPAVHNNLGTALAATGRMPDALAEFAEAVRLEPGFAAAQLNLAVALRAAGRLQEAAEHYDQALRLGAPPPDRDSNLRPNN